MCYFDAIYCLFTETHPLLECFINVSEALHFILPLLQEPQELLLQPLQIKYDKITVNIEIQILNVTHLQNYILEKVYRHGLTVKKFINVTFWLILPQCMYISKMLVHSSFMFCDTT